MKRLFVFPGQGSQYIGMGKDLYDNFSGARTIFNEVDDALNQKLSDIIFNGPEELLTHTENTQPALMAVSMAVLEVLKSHCGLKITSADYAAGHSLGEYSALCAGGVFSLADTARLLKIRGQAMQRAVPLGVGSMAAILGLSFEQVEEIVKQSSENEVCQAANDNSDGQIVISGHKNAVERASELAKQAGAKRVVALSVSAPFHCSLMAPAAQEMTMALDNIIINPSQFPVIANVLVEPISQPDIIKNALIQQITGRVRWRETMEWTNKNDITHIYEIGAGKVLASLCKRAVKNADSVSIGRLQDIHDCSVFA